MENTELDFYIDYSRLDKWQRGLIDRNLDKSMVVKGDAGTGKSLIALHKAKSLAATGKSCAIVVYTKTLCKFFSDGLKSLGLSNVYHYKKWKRYIQMVDYLVVDECQDFTHEEIEDMKCQGNICFFFGDSEQSIMDFPDHPTQSVEKTAQDMNIELDELYTNYRLTKEIALLAEEITPNKNLAEKCVRTGEKPNLINAPNYDAQLDRIIEIIQNRSLKNVGVLMPYNRGGNMSVEYVKDYFLNKGIPCEFKYEADKETEMELDFHSGNPKIMTWWCAKGLQFQDVFIPGCEYNFGPSRLKPFYVAMTRCCERLYLVFSNGLSSFFPSINPNLVKMI